MLVEDGAFNDITSRLLLDKKIIAVIKSNESCILCGVDFAARLFRLRDPNLKIKIIKKDGSKIKKGNPVMKITGDARSILSTERVALNLISHLSGIATLTKKYVQKSKVPVFDTRKTHPLLRYFEKYAVRCGGGFNHRMNLENKILLKDNHLKIIKSPPSGVYEVEVQDFKDIKKIAESNPEWIMLDNMDFKQLKKSIEFLRKNYPHIKIEVSGGVNLKNIEKISKLKPDRISTGKIIMGACAIDFSCDVEEVL